MNVALVGSSDRQLEELLLAAGARISMLRVDDLAGLASPLARQPEILVLDHRSGAALPPALTAIRRQHPSTGILLILSALDPAVMLDAMRAGISECVAKPLSGDDLKSALQRISSNRPAVRGGEVFAVVGAKGGVGATTVAVNVATILSKLRPSSTLLIDLHLTYGDAGVYLGAEPRFSIVDALENMHRMDATFLRTLVTTTKSGVALLASPDHQVAVTLDVGRVRALIELASAEYPYVVLDVPRSDAVMLDALKAAGAIIIVANQEVATVRSAGRMAASMEKRYTKDRVNVVMTRFADSSDIGRKDVERVVGRPVSWVFPNNYQAAVESQNKGRPLVIDNNTELASAFAGYARSLAGMPAEQEKPEKSSGLLSRFGARRR